MNTLPCIPSTMLVERSVLADLLPLTHRHGADDVGMKIELARRPTSTSWTNRSWNGGARTTRCRVRGSTSRAGNSSFGRTRTATRSFPSGFARETVAQTHVRTGHKRLEERCWSLRATLAFVRAAYVAPEHHRADFALVVASLLGRPGLSALDQVRD